MERNDIQADAPIKQACLFEGVLAAPPVKTLQKLRAAKAVRQHEWHRYIGMWTPYEMPLKSLVDSVNRRGIGVEVYTCLHEGVVDAIDRWLARKGVSVPVYQFENLSLIHI